MLRTMRVCLGFCLLIRLASQVMAQEGAELVDTGVIFSADELDRSTESNRIWGVTPPYWTPSPEDVARLESQLKLYLETVVHPGAKAVVTELAGYKKQYWGYIN